MAKPVESVGSDRGELKRLLKMAVDKPIPMAFALGADGKAIVKLDKIKQGRSLERGLKEDAAGSRNHRFGSVVVDSEHPGVAKFIVNKQVTGIVRKLVIALKGTGYKKVVVVDEDGAALEEHEEEDEGGKRRSRSVPRSSRWARRRTRPRARSRTGECRRLPRRRRPIRPRPTLGCPTLGCPTLGCPTLGCPTARARLPSMIRHR